MADKISIICDFDGVLHSYDSGWQGADVIPDPPVKGAVDWLNSISESVDVNILSTRSTQEGGIDAMKAWLEENGVVISRLSFPTEKVPAVLTVDDRAICFTGNNYPTVDEIKEFKPWTDKGFKGAIFDADR